MVLGEWLLGKKIKTEGVGKNNEREGKRRKGEKKGLKRIFKG